MSAVTQIQDALGRWRDQELARRWFATLLLHIEDSPSESWPSKEGVVALLDSAWAQDAETLRETQVSIADSMPPRGTDGAYDSPVRLMVIQLATTDSPLTEEIVEAFFRLATKNLTNENVLPVVDPSANTYWVQQFRAHEDAREAERIGGTGAHQVARIVAEFAAKQDGSPEDPREQIGALVRTIRKLEPPK